MKAKWFWKYTISVFLAFLVMFSVPKKINGYEMSHNEDNELKTVLKLNKPLTTKWADKEYAKSVLFSLAKNEEKYRVLESIIECESSWGHFWEPWRFSIPKTAKEGDVKISKGNVGYAQINATVWEKWFKEMIGLDIYDPRENLEAAVLLYDLQGIRPWKEWSGTCFLQKL